MLLTEKSHTTYIQQSKSTVMVAASCLSLRWLLLGVSASASALQVLDEMPKRAFRYAVVSQPCFLLRSARIRYPITIHRPASSFCSSNALISAGRCVHGRAVQGQLRGRLPPGPGGWRRRRRRARASGRAVDAGGGGRVQRPHHRVLGPFRSHRGRRRRRRCPVPYPLVHSGS